MRFDQVTRQERASGCREAYVEGSELRGKCAKAAENCAEFRKLIESLLLRLKDTALQVQSAVQEVLLQLIRTYPAMQNLPKRLPYNQMLSLVELLDQNSQGGDLPAALPPSFTRTPGIGGSKKFVHLPFG